MHGEELHNLNSSASITRKIKARKMRWVGHVARIGGNRNKTGFWWEATCKITSWMVG